MADSRPDHAAARDEWKPVRKLSWVRPITTTKLLTDGDGWRVECSCGWKSRTYRKRKTAERRLEPHHDFHKESIYA